MYIHVYIYEYNRGTYVQALIIKPTRSHTDSHTHPHTHTHTFTLSHTCTRTHSCIQLITHTDTLDHTRTHMLANIGVVDVREHRASNTYKYKNIYVYFHLHVHKCVCVYKCVSKCVSKCMHAHMCTHTHFLIRTHAHMYIQQLMHASNAPSIVAKLSAVGAAVPKVRVRVRVCVRVRVLLCLFALLLPYPGCGHVQRWECVCSVCVTMCCLGVGMYRGGGVYVLCV